MASQDKREIRDLRGVLGTWLEGPRAAAEAQGVQFAPRGVRLGLPETGSGSVAPLGRRLLALVIDWLMAMGIVRALGTDTSDQRYSWFVLVVFGLVTSISLALTGRTVGHAVVRLRLLDIGPAGRTPFQPLRVLLRQVLVCLVVPACIWDADGRGLHDKAARTVLVRL